MPIDAFLFGGRRATVVPLVFEAFDWEHGVFLGSIMGSEKTAAAAGGVGELRFDPMAMLPFCGYHMADYFGHWLEDRPPRRREAAEDLHGQLVPQGRRRQFLWPGFGENSRVLDVLPPLRRRGRGGGDPDRAGSGGGALDVSGLGLSPGAMEQLLSVDPDEWRRQPPQIHQHFAQFGDSLPDELAAQLAALEERLD